MKTKIFISLFILCFLSACNLPTTSSHKPKEPSYTNVTFRIKGTITESTNNSPVIGARANLGGGFYIWASANTNNEGHYTLEYTVSWDNSWGDDRLWFYIEATGYKTKWIEHTDINHVRITEEWQIIDVQLEPESGGLR
jgi:hypothetical protein